MTNAVNCFYFSQWYGRTFLEPGSILYLYVVCIFMLYITDMNILLKVSIKKSLHPPRNMLSQKHFVAKG